MKKIFLLSVISATAFFNLSASDSNIEVKIEDAGPAFLEKVEPLMAVPLVPDTDDGYSDSGEDNAIYIKVQVKAQYPGGYAELGKFITSNLQYPKEAAADSAQGKVIVEFVIEKDGSVSNARIARSVHPALDKEALRVVKIMKGWIPAKNGSKVVRSKLRLPVDFRM